MFDFEFQSFSIILIHFNLYPLGRTTEASLTRPYKKKNWANWHHQIKTLCIGSWTWVHLIITIIVLICNFFCYEPVWQYLVSRELQQLPTRIGPTDITKSKSYINLTKQNCERNHQVIEVITTANLPCSPGCMHSITSLSASTALMGITPPPKAFPSIWIRRPKWKSS